MNSGQAFQYRCCACNEGEVVFKEWGIMDGDVPCATAADDGYLGMVLGCTTCKQQYLCLPV